MSSFKFGQTKVASKDFHRQKQITDILTIDVNKVVLSDIVSCNNGKDWWDIVGYQDGETIALLFTMTPKNMFSYRASQYDSNSGYQTSFNLSEAPEWVLHYSPISNEVELQLFKKLIIETIKGKSKYMNGKLKTWKESFIFKMLQTTCIATQQQC